MKGLILGGIYGIIWSFVLPKVGITADSFDYWAIIVSTAAITTFVLG